MVFTTRIVPPPNSSRARRKRDPPIRFSPERTPDDEKKSRKPVTIPGRLSDNTIPTYGGVRARCETHPPFASPSRSSRLAFALSAPPHPSPRARIQASEYTALARSGPASAAFPASNAALAVRPASTYSRNATA